MVIMMSVANQNLVDLAMVVFFWGFVISFCIALLGLALYLFVYSIVKIGDLLGGEHNESRRNGSKK